MTSMNCRNVRLTVRQISILTNLCQHAIDDPAHTLPEAAEARTIQAALLEAAPELAPCPAPTTPRSG